MRSSTEAVDELLRDLLSEYVADVDGAPANYSVSIREQPSDPRAARSVHHLYRSTRPVARSRSAGRIVRALLQHLAGVLHPPLDGQLAVRALPLVVDHRAVLAPGRLFHDLATFQPYLRRVGLQLVDVPHATIDPGRAELIVPDVRLELRPDAAARLQELEWSAAVDDRGVAPGRYPLAGWAFPAGDPSGPLSPDRARLWAYPTVIDGARRGVRTAFDDLDRLLARVPAVSVSSSPPALSRVLAELARTS